MPTPNTQKKGHIWIVDDDGDMRALLQDFFTTEGYRTSVYPLASMALEEFRRQAAQPAGPDVDAIVSDLKMAQMDGMEFLREMKNDDADIPIILITGFGSIDTVIEAMRNGAYHYLVKPFKLAEMAVTVERAMERRRLSRENAFLRNEVKKGFSLGNAIGKSPSMRAIFDLVGRVAQSTANVLITGESGTGKEVIAKAVHYSGPRASKPFVAINCTAIPETLLESELFGHAKGSFTGAVQKKRGLFEEADGGTLFLDEIGDMSPQLQGKLLRVLQERKIRPVGDNHMIDVDVRIIAATHKDLKVMIRDGRFRDDLFYRLSVIPIEIPALRDRPEDIPLLADFFLNKYTAANGSQVRGFTKTAMAKLVKLRWEGNVRELENLIERAVVLSQGEWIDENDIPEPETNTPDQFFRTATTDFPTLAQLEERYIRLVLDRMNGKKERAAQILGINRRTLYRKEREYGWCAQEENFDNGVAKNFEGIPPRDTTPPLTN